MDFRIITDLEEASRIYKDRIEADFPPSERAPLRFFLRNLEQSDSRLYLYEKEGEAVAYAMFSEAEGYVLLNLFAVYPGQRGSGVGSALLQDFKDAYADKKGIIVEVEHLDYAVDIADASVRKKRMAFYQRCGYRCLSDFDLLLFGEHYHILVRPIEEDRTGDLSYFYNLFREIYGGVANKIPGGAVQWVRSPGKPPQSDREQV